MWATTLHDHAVPAVQWGTALGASLAAAVFDARSRRIPNLLTGSLLLSGLVHAAIVAGGAGLADAAAATVLLALPYVILFACAGGGAGDAKLMGGIGAWLGLVNGTVALCAVCLCGIVMALLWAASRRRLAEVRSSVMLLARGVAQPLFGVGSLRDVPALMPSPDECQKMPYGPAICAGVAVAAAGTHLWIF